MLVGFASGILSGMFGVGGAVLTTPGIRVLGATPIEAIGSTIPAILPGSASGAIRYSRAALVDWRVALSCGALGSAFAVIGANVSNIVNAHYLMLLTAALLLWSGVKNLLTPREHRVLAVPGGGPVDAEIEVDDGSALDRVIEVGDPALAVPAPPSRSPSLVLVAPIGVAAGFLAGLLGVGGGILMVPLLTLWVGLDQRRAVATSLAAIVLSSTTGSISYLLRGAVDVPAAVALAAGSVVGAVAGTALLKRLPLPVLRWAFVALLVGVAVRLLFPVPAHAGPVPLSFWPLAGMVVLGLAVGVASGLFGIGGGVLIVPSLVLLFGVGELIAKGTSLLVMIPTGVVGTARNLRAGLVDVGAVLAVGLPAIVAAVVGSALAFVLPAPLSSVLFALLLLVVSAQLVLRLLRDRRRRGARP